jgi:hypothetical protein
MTPEFKEMLREYVVNMVDEFEMMDVTDDGDQFEAIMEDLANQVENIFEEYEKDA